jgi:hypothetical protein
VAWEFEDAKHSIQSIVLEHTNPFIGEELPITFGHDGLPCHCPGSPDVLFHIADTNGIHSTRVRFCECTPDSPSIQLLKAGFFPVTMTQPKMAFSFNLLKLFDALHLESKVSAYDFIGGLRYLSDHTLARSVVVGDAH